MAQLAAMYFAASRHRSKTEGASGKEKRKKPYSAPFHGPFLIYAPCLDTRVEIKQCINTVASPKCFEFGIDLTLNHYSTMFQDLRILK